MTDMQKYFNNFSDINKNPSLDAMKYFVDEYDNFEKGMKFIHIAGTNGKGSCAEIISNILTIQGYKTGKFISPHLIKYNERISIEGRQILNKELSDLMCELIPKIDIYNKKHEKNVTFFELETIIAMLYFYRNNVDFVVLETGLGGLYDCTNIISSPLISIITSIGYDHMNILGETLQQIAHQKAGIIKKNSNTIFFEQSNEINEIITNTCIKKKSTLHLIDKNKVKNYSYNSNYQYFDYGRFKNLSINLKGWNQIRNACLCVEGIKILNDKGYKISEKSLRAGLSTVIHKGRMDLLSQKPFIIYDGAHNKTAIENLVKTIDMYYKDYKRLYVISILKRKDYESMLKLLLEDRDAIFLLTSGSGEIFVSGEELYETSEKYKWPNQKIYVKNFDEAIEFVMREKNNCVNFIVGSFYMYGDAVKKIKEIR